MLRRILLVVVVILGLFVLAVSLWIHSDGDLRTEDAAMRAAGLPATWAEVPPFVASPDVIRRVTEVRELAERIGCYQPGEKTTDVWLGLSPGKPPSEEARVWAGQVPAADLNRLLAGVDALPSSFIEVRPLQTHSTSMPELQQDRNLIKHLQLRLALAAPAEVGIASARLLHVARWLPQRSLIQCLVRYSLQSAVVNALLARPEPGRVNDLVEGLRQFAAANRELRRQAFLGEYLTCRDTLKSVDSAATVVSFSGDPWLIPRSVWDMEVPDAIRIWQAKLLIRLGRGRLLRALRDDTILPMSSPMSDRQALAWGKLMEGRYASQPGWDYAGKTQRQFWPAIEMVTKLSVKNCLYLELAAAHLANEPWPEDPCQPPGHPLKPIVRNGKVIGAYGVGQDGHDDGGSMYMDWCFALTEKLGKRKAGDPPESP